jgi:hypothetical protein
MRAWFLGLSTAIALSFATNATGQEIRAPGTAIPGLGLIGAEVASSVSTAFGVRKAPVLFAVTSLGAAVGIVGGIFANRIQAPLLHDVVGVSTLTIGMGGVVPATLIVLQIRSNDSTREKKDKKEKRSKKDDAPTALLVPPGLLNYREGEVSLSAPTLMPLIAKEKENPLGAVLFSGNF